MENAQAVETKHVAEIKLSYKTRVKPSMRRHIATSQAAYSILMDTWNKDRIEFLEEFKVLLLNRANKVLGLLDLSVGGVSGTIVDPKIIFAAALKANASGIIVAHNHPSGNLNASASDIELTKRLREGRKLLEIQLLDHLIITVEKYTSFADEGLI